MVHSRRPDWKLKLNSGSTSDNVNHSGISTSPPTVPGFPALRYGFTHNTPTEGLEET